MGLSLASSSKSANWLISAQNWISGFNIYTQLYTYPVEYTYPIENIPYQFKIFTWVSNNFTEILTFVKWFTTFNHFKQFLSNLTIKNLKLGAQLTLFSLESLCTQQCSTSTEGKRLKNCMTKSFLKRNVLKGKKLSPLLTLNEQPLVLSSPSAHKTTTDYGGNSAQEIRKTG